MLNFKNMLDTKQIRVAAINGICPECGALLRLSRIRKKRWFSKKSKTTITGIECPNKHDLDYNKRLGFTKSIYRDTTVHYDLSDYTNIIYEDTKHKAIKIQYDKFYAWLSD